ncbi:MAG: hypothetical protein AN484_17720 [Aphanizomenon flos-aquae WA102]|jgi:hypothetical protein|uniref:Uncharacterized protein n=1 Tax=Aphanizomenon flos-aquae WA102 TaxID=1710896 RepID=A0A1B7WZ86_APHFL|nr:MAG: hypothetical protein AN484_17720 [Aphanizomenon flos-aquae WA102]
MLTVHEKDFNNSCGSHSTTIESTEQLIDTFNGWIDVILVTNDNRIKAKFFIQSQGKKGSIFQYTICI